MKILFKMTSRSRRSNFLRGIESIVNNVANKSNYYILISVESELNDPTMHPLPQLDCPHTYKVNTGKPTTKVDAINRDLNEFTEVCDWDILVNMSDDVVFTQKGFDNIIRDEFYFKSDMMSSILDRDVLTVNRDYCIHFPDGNRSDLLTVSILGRKYYNRDNYIYNPEYKSLYCDNEAMEVAKMRGCYKYVDRHIFNHLHPAYGKGQFDLQYQQTESFSNEDRITYERRKANGFV